VFNLYCIVAKESL